MYIYIYVYFRKISQYVLHSKRKWYKMLNPTKNSADLICTILILVKNLRYLKKKYRRFIVLRWRAIILPWLNPQKTRFGNEMCKIRFLSTAGNVVVQFSIGNINSLSLFHFQWKKRYTLKQFWCILFTNLIFDSIWNIQKKNLFRQVKLKQAPRIFTIHY
jgi:hypothetical protein